MIFFLLFLNYSLFYNQLYTYFFDHRFSIVSFKKGGIFPKFIIIDDGWQSCSYGSQYSLYLVFVLL